MQKSKEQLKTVIRPNFEGKDRMYLTDLAEFEGRNPKLKTFSLAKLLPGEQVGFHEHIGESESYYIISGKGVYNDNGAESEIGPGDVTFTPSGESHGIRNTGDEMLEFIALVILD